MSFDYSSQKVNSFNNLSENEINIIKSVIFESLKIEEDMPVPFSQYLTELGLTSMKFVEIVVALEDQLNISLNDELLIFENFATIEETIITIIKNKEL